MTQNGNPKIRDEAIRAMIFVFVLLAVAEVVAPFLKIDFHDPLLLTAAVTGILTHVIVPHLNSAKPKVLVVKDENVTDTIQKLTAQGYDVSVAATPDHALTLVKQMTPEKSGVIARIKNLVDLVK